jgi:hypothetical protein
MLWQTVGRFPASLTHLIGADLQHRTVLRHARIKKAEMYVCTNQMTHLIGADLQHRPVLRHARKQKAKNKCVYVSITAKKSVRMNFMHC